MLRLNLFLFKKMNQKSQEFYKRLEEELSKTSLWPSDYLYKFIVPTEDTKIKRLEKSFDNTGAVIHTNRSKTGKYTSISVNVRMIDPQAVIKKYIEVSDIEGLISL